MYKYDIVTLLTGQHVPFNNTYWITHLHMNNLQFYIAIAIVFPFLYNNVYKNVSVYISVLVGVCAKMYQIYVSI